MLAYGITFRVAHRPAAWEPDEIEVRVDRDEGC